MLDKSRTNDGNNSEHAYATTCPTSREIDSETTPSRPIGFTADVCVPVGAHTRSANASLSLNARQIFHPTICRAFSLRRRPRVKRATGTFHRLAASRVSRRNPSTRKRSHSSFSPRSSLRETLTITWPSLNQWQRLAQAMQDVSLYQQPPSDGCGHKASCPAGPTRFRLRPAFGRSVRNRNKRH